MLKITDILPPPFAWCPIPAGNVTLVESEYDGGYIKKGEKRTFDVSAFNMAKYPVTNAQFAKFIEAGGYENQQWWTEAGWQARQEAWAWNGEERKATGNAWTEPRYWQYNNFNLLDHPVVGVSWYEAVAFCQWLSEATSEKVGLPSEQQWQRAAQGNDGRAYPWGEKLDKSRCNVNSSGTTPVIWYAGEDKGDSVFGVSDMSGNVWEWCSTSWEKGKDGLDGTDARLFRGGSWFFSFAEDLRVDCRTEDYPNSWAYNVGFRIACSS